MKGYETNALSFMNQWTQAGANGFVYNFSVNATSQLKSPWTAGTNAVNAFKTGTETAMAQVVSNIKSNVVTATGELEKIRKLYAEINSTTLKAPTGGNGDRSDVDSTGLIDSKGGTIDTDVERLQAILNKFFGANLDIDGKYGPATTAAVKVMQKKIGDITDGLYTNVTKEKLQDYLNKLPVSSWFKETGIYVPKAIKSRAGGGGGGVGRIEHMIYAKGTMGTTEDQWAITDEPWLGDELVLVPTASGNLSYMRKGTSVVPADITANLVEWGKLNPNMLNVGGGANISMISNAVNKPEFNFDVENFLKVERVDKDTLPELEKMMDKKIDNLVRQLNYSIKKFK
jgi:peptidoglycan hydrolase-like protein with peptidoglycan-binding domain